ncbi:MAG: [Muribaculaceae bacterium]|nr:[FeFe] hydrogenase H-cluster radical SAM maturase HydE [Muribaculaceae bacterium]
MKSLVDRLATLHTLDAEGYRALLECDSDTESHLKERARDIATERFGHGIYVRGLIEISNYCRNNCLYCGLRRDNRNITRYQLSDDEIIDCCAKGYAMGLRTFVLQSGEDNTLSDSRITNLIGRIADIAPKAAITLSLGERSKDSYIALFNAGASRYLLRHEAANRQLYASLHPEEMSWSNRIDCAKSLIAIGYQTGMGMMIGAPGQTTDHLIDDLLLLQQIRPQMVGIGPFIPQADTPLGNHTAGAIGLTLRIIAIVRLMLPDALIPATTALATLDADARNQAILSGANVVMPNLSPTCVRDKYAIYDNKAATATESAEGIASLQQQLNSIGYHINYSRGDFQQYDRL